VCSKLFPRASLCKCEGLCVVVNSVYVISHTGGIHSSPTSRLKQKAILRCPNASFPEVDFPCSVMMLGHVGSMKRGRRRRRWVREREKVPLVNSLQPIKTAGVERASGMTVHPLKTRNEEPMLAYILRWNTAQLILSRLTLSLHMWGTFWSFF